MKMNNIDLKKIIEQHPDCITNGSKLKGIILDLYPDTPKAIINTLVLMANSGMSKEIQDSENITDLNKSRWQQKLEDEGFSEKLICSCLNMVFIAFGLNGACTSNDEKLVVGSSVSIQTKNILPPTNLSDFEIKDGVLENYIGKSSVVVIPDSVTSIGWFAFRYCSGLTSVTIPNSVTSIGYSAFEDCSRLASVTIGNGVTSIGWSAFSGCSGLMSITIPDSVNFIGRSAFYGCKNLKYNEYDNALYLGNDNNPYVALIKAKSKDITNCTISDKCKVIGWSAFGDCSRLTSVTIPNSVTSICSSAFSGCRGLTSVTMGNCVTSISEYAFV